MDKKAVIKEAQERYSASVEAESDSRTAMLDDVRFEAGDQWPLQIKRMRETDPDGARPCLTINMTRKHKNALLNDIRRNRPQIKTLPVDDKADIETAKILNGLLRHIQVVSDADIAYDTAADHQVTSGLGFFRILTEVVDEEKNEQEVRVGQILNPFSVRMDFHADHPAGADAKWCFIEEEMPNEKFKKLYPKAEASDFGSKDDDAELWYPDKDTIRVAEYFCIKEEEGKKQCMWYLLAGDAVLEERELPCSYIPVIRVIGEERRYDDKRDFRGIVRDLREPQMMYNYNKSAYVERVSLSPKAPYIAPAEALEGHEDDWSDANTANRPVLNYNQFSESGERLDRPQRSPPTPVEVALLNAMVQDQEDMRQVSGQNQAGFGESGNETSGRAINARRAEQDSNTFHFVDNLSRSIKHAGRIIVEMIPKVYDTRRVVRILGEDETPEFATFDPNVPRAMVEQPDINGAIQRIYNPSLGRYDVRVVVGPSYATRAEEGADRLSQIIQAAPDLMAIAGDILFKNMDIPGSDDLAERMKAMLPPQIQELENAKNDGRQQAAQQAEMVRQQMMQQIAPMVEQLKAALDEAAAENDELTSTVEDMKRQLDDKRAEYEIKAAETQIKADEVAVKRQEAMLDHEADMAKAEADVATAYITAKSGGERKEPSEGDSVSNTSAAFASQQAAQMMMDMVKQLTDQVQAITAASQDSVQGVEEAQDEQSKALEQLAARVAAGEAQRERMADIAAGLLSGKMTEDAAAVAITRRLN